MHLLRISLVDFQRFLEDEQLDCLKFHKLKQLNAIFKYRTRLIEQANAGLISASSARNRINAVVNFYRFLVTEDLDRSPTLRASFPRCLQIYCRR